jgi:cell division protein FtsB
MIEWIIYVVLAAWSSLLTWFITKKKITREQLETKQIELEQDYLSRQSKVVQILQGQNQKLIHLYSKFQVEIENLHREILELRVENVGLKTEISELNNTIQLLIKVNEAEKTFD